MKELIVFLIGVAIFGALTVPFYREGRGSKKPKPPKPLKEVKPLPEKVQIALGIPLVIGQFLFTALCLAAVLWFFFGNW